MLIRLCWDRGRGDLLVLPVEFVFYFRLLCTAHHRDPRWKNGTEPENVPGRTDKSPQNKRAIGPRNEQRHNGNLPSGMTTQHIHSSRKNPQEHHGTPTEGTTTRSQITQRNMHIRMRRRTASTSPQRSDASNDTDHNIDTTIFGLNGNTITKLKLNANDTSLSFGHLYHHTKTNLQLSEKTSPW